jgi:hypothetical protein
MIFDDAIVITPTAISEAVEDDSDLMVYPNPSSSAATVTYILRSAAEVSLDLFTPDGRKLRTSFTVEKIRDLACINGPRLITSPQVIT